MATTARRRDRQRRSLRRQWQRHVLRRGSGNRHAQSGGNGNDHLAAGAGNDLLSGGNGDDWLGAGAGDDILTGGNGNDTFVFASEFGPDIVTDFRGRPHRVRGRRIRQFPGRADGEPSGRRRRRHHARCERYDYAAARQLASLHASDFLFTLIIVRRPTARASRITPRRRRSCSRPAPGRTPPHTGLRRARCPASPLPDIAAPGCAAGSHQDLPVRISNSQPCQGHFTISPGRE